MPRDPVSNPSRDPERRVRLHQTDSSKELSPFRKAPSATDCNLYWIPVTSWPIPSRERAWLLQFIRQFHSLTESLFELRGEFFLDYHIAKDVDRKFQKSAIELIPFLGLARRPGAGLPEQPTQDEMRAAAHENRPFDVKKYMPTYCYWFLNQDLDRLLSLFFGFGGTSMIYLARDPNTIPPEIPHLDEIKELFPGLPFEKLEAMNSAVASMGDGFLKKSKLLFGVGLEEEPVYDGLPFIVPLLQTSDFFDQPQEEREKWFQLFDLHWRESPVNGGVFLASKPDVEEKLIELLQQMREAGQVYPVA